MRTVDHVLLDHQGSSKHPHEGLLRLVQGKDDAGFADRISLTAYVKGARKKKQNPCHIRTGQSRKYPFVRPHYFQKVLHQERMRGFMIDDQSVLSVQQFRQGDRNYSYIRFWVYSLRQLAYALFNAKQHLIYRKDPLALHFDRAPLELE